jgi:WxL domain surface cell wall-binding
VCQRQRLKETDFNMFRQRIFTFLGIGLAALILGSAALAGTITASATVSGAGSIALSNGATASLTSTLDGTDQAVSYTVPLTLTDARGSGAGWNLTLTSTTFDDGAGHTLSTSASTIASVAMACIGGNSCTSATNSITYPLTIPAAVSAPAAVKVFNSAANTGMGRLTITPTVNVAIPGNSYAGTYTSTLTVAAVSGP